MFGVVRTLRESLGNLRIRLKQVKGRFLWRQAVLGRATEPWRARP
jgi:hypothetical protein